MRFPIIRRSPSLGLAVVGLGASIGPLDFAVAVAFPAITAAFGLETSATRWVAVWYVLSYGSLMLVFGALGDRIGHLRVFRLGLALSLLSFVACGLVTSYHGLLATRVLQGIAVALTLSCGPALAMAQVDDTQRTRALSRYAAMAAFAAVVAPVVGGQAIATLGWQGVFWFRVPIALLALACLPLLGREAEAARHGARSPFDLGGLALLAAGVALLLLLPALIHADSRVWQALPVAAGGAWLMARFVRRQRASATPFLPHAVVREATFVTANLSSVVMQFASFTVPLLVPYYLKRIAASGPLVTGVLLAIWALGSMGGSSIASRMVASLGASRVALYAGLLGTCGLFGVASWSLAPGYGWMVACLLLQGLGIGLYQVAYADLVVAALPPSSRGVAGSLTMVTRTVGIVIGASAWMGMLQTLEERGVAAGLSANAAFVDAFRHALLAGALVAGLFFVLTWRRWR